MKIILTSIAKRWHDGRYSFWFNMDVDGVPASYEMPHDKERMMLELGAEVTKFLLIIVNDGLQYHDVVEYINYMLKKLNP